MDIRQPILLLIAIAVPFLLFRLKRPDLVVGWVAITLSIHVFDTSTVTNLPAARLVGLMYLPQALVRLPSWLRFRPIAAWVLNFAYLLVLGIIFGFLLPWPDASGGRSWPTTAPGRAIVYPVRLLADLSLMIFLAEQLRRPGMILYLGRMIILGATVTAVAGILQLIIPALDPYNLVTGLDPRDIALGRARGFSFEPRGLGLACAYGLMVLLVYPAQVTLSRNARLVANLLGVLVTYSTSALIVIAAGLATIWSFLSNRMRLNVLGAVVVIPVLALIVSFAAPEQFQHGVEGIQERTSTERLQGAVAQNLLEEIAWRFDIFDSSALLFLGTHPEYILTGTGPGEIMLAASGSLPPGVFTIIFGESGLNGVPTMGLLLEICNSGLIGAAVWFVQFFSCRRAFAQLSSNPSPDGNRNEWRFGQALFLIGAVFFLVQTPLEQAYWPILLSVGWAAVSTAAESRRVLKRHSSLETQTQAM